MSSPSEEKDVREVLAALAKYNVETADQFNAMMAKYIGRMTAAEWRATKLAEEVESNFDDAKAYAETAKWQRERAEAAEAKLAVVQNFHAHPGHYAEDRSGEADDQPSYRRGWHDAVFAILARIAGSTTSTVGEEKPDEAREAARRMLHQVYAPKVPAQDVGGLEAGDLEWLKRRRVVHPLGGEIPLDVQEYNARIDRLIAALSIKPQERS